MHVLQFNEVTLMASNVVIGPFKIAISPFVLFVIFVYYEGKIETNGSHDTDRLLLTCKLEGYTGEY